MQSYFQSILTIFVSIFKFFFQEDTSKRKQKQRRAAYDRLLSISICDTIEFAVKQPRIYYSSNNLPEQPVVQQKEQILHPAPIIPDIKKQFKIWSENMKEYDAIRKRLLESSSTIPKYNQLC